MKTGCPAKPVKVALAGAQTGGHLLPAVETGAVLRHMGFDVVLVTSGEAVEKQILVNAGIPVRSLKVGRIKTMGLVGRVKGALSIPGSLFRAGRLVHELQPDVVAGFGGFTSGPFVMAASLMGIPTTVFEANSIPGITNRILARRARKVFVSFAGAAARLGRKDAIMTGTPVRPSILEVKKSAWTAPGHKILVIGGSQGSRFLNQTVPEVAVALLSKLQPGSASLEVRHQCGLGNAGSVAARYRELGVEAVVSEYIQNMAEAYAWADFIICRSGAGTVSEVAVVGLPALFVPFAAAADDHQAHNAMDLAAAGAAIMTREENFDVEAVAGTVAAILGSPDSLNSMSAAAVSAGRRDAAAQIAEGIAGLVKR